MRSLAGSLPKAVVVFLFNLCASIYIGIGVYGLVLDMQQRVIRSHPLWHSAIFGMAAILCIRGICYFGALWDGILARESALPPHPAA